MAHVETHPAAPAAVADAPAANLDGMQRTALLVGAAGLLVGVIGAFLAPEQFFRSYLLAYTWVISITLGSLGVTLLHNVVGGRWGAVIKQFLESGIRTLPLMALLVLPLLLGIPYLYEWSHADAVEHDPLLRHKAPFLNVPFWVLRLVLYFAVWFGLAFLLSRRRVGETRADIASRHRAISAPGLILYVFTVTLAAIDWVMSMEPHWVSTMYGAIYVVGQVLITLAFCIWLLGKLSDRAPFAGLIKATHYHDLGTLMFAFTVLWTYTTFSQLLIIWNGNLPEETPWYIRRTHFGLQYVAFALGIFHFAVPFFILLSRFVKRRPHLLLKVAAFMIFMRFVDLFYWVKPADPHLHSFPFHWLDLALPLGMAGLWLWFFLFQLKKGPLLNVDDPRLVVEGAHH